MATRTTTTTLAPTQWKIREKKEKKLTTKPKTQILPGAPTAAGLREFVERVLPSHRRNKLVTGSLVEPVPTPCLNPTTAVVAQVTATPLPQITSRTAEPVATTTAPIPSLNPAAAAGDSASAPSPASRATLGVIATTPAGAGPVTPAPAALATTTLITAAPAPATAATAASVATAAPVELDVQVPLSIRDRLKTMELASSLQLKADLTAIFSAEEDRKLQAFMAEFNRRREAWYSQRPDRRPVLVTFDLVALRHHDPLRTGPPLPASKRADVHSICVQGLRSEADILWFHENFSTTMIRQTYAPLRLSYDRNLVGRSARIAPASGSHEQAEGVPDEIIDVPSLARKTLCGTQIRWLDAGEPRWISTIGGLVDVAGTLMAITSAHPPVNLPLGLGDDSHSMGSTAGTTELSEKDYDHNVESPLILDVAPFSSPMEIVEISHPGPRSPHANTNPFRTSSPRSPRSNTNPFRASHALPPRSSTNPFRTSTPVGISIGDREEQFNSLRQSPLPGTIDVPLDRSVASEGGDWRLWPVGSGLSLPNWVNWVPDSFIPRASFITDYLKQPSLMEVRIVCSSDRLLTGTLSPSSSFFSADGKPAQPVWSLFPNGALREGDSGSWVVGTEGQLAGMVTAFSATRVYLVPFHVQKSHLESGTSITLPSPLRCFLDDGQREVLSSGVSPEFFQLLEASERMGDRLACALTRAYSASKNLGDSERLSKDAALAKLLVQRGNNLRNVLDKMASEDFTFFGSPTEQDAIRELFRFYSPLVPTPWPPFAPVASEVQRTDAQGSPSPNDGIGPSPNKGLVKFTWCLVLVVFSASFLIFTSIAAGYVSGLVILPQYTPTGENGSESTSSIVYNQLGLRFGLFSSLPLAAGGVVLQSTEFLYRHSSLRRVLDRVNLYLATIIVSIVIIGLGFARTLIPLELIVSVVYKDIYQGMQFSASDKKRLLTFTSVHETPQACSYSSRTAISVGYLFQPPCAAEPFFSR